MSDYGFWAETNEEVTREELEERVEETLNEVYEPFTMGDLTYMPGDILRELDPIAWRMTVSDEHDSLMQVGEIVEELDDEED